MTLVIQKRSEELVLYYFTIEEYQARVVRTLSTNFYIHISQWKPTQKCPRVSFVDAKPKKEEVFAINQSITILFIIPERAHCDHLSLSSDLITPLVRS